MAKHITHKKLAGLIAGTLSSRSAGTTARHLDECDRCRALHGRLISAMAPRYGGLTPGPEVKQRVMRSWQELQGAPSRRPGLSGFIAAHPRTLMAGAFAVVAAAVTALIILTLPPGPAGPPSLTATLVKGDVILNGRAARPMESVRPGSAITLDEQSMVRLSYGSALSITLFGRGSFTIDRMRMHGTPGRLELVCTLDEGILLSRTAAPVSYAYNTPGARIEPHGTEFLLQASGAKTLVIMKQGAVTVKPTDGGKPLDIAAGSRCMIDREASAGPASPKDLEIFGSVERLRTGEFAPLLIAPPTDKERVRKAEKTGMNGDKIRSAQKKQDAEDAVTTRQEQNKPVDKNGSERRERNIETKGFEKVEKKKDQSMLKEIRKRANRENAAQRARKK